MSRSTRLATAVHVMVYLAMNDGIRVRIDEIAESAGVNPSRLRQLCSQLSRGGFIRTYKGARGGIRSIAKPDDVTLFDLCLCMEEDTFFALAVHEGNEDCSIGGKVTPIVQELFQKYNENFKDYLRETTIQDMVSLTKGQQPQAHKKPNVAKYKLKRYKDVLQRRRRS